MSRIPGLIFIICVALAIAGCGGSDDSSSTGSTGSTNASSENPDSGSAGSTSAEATSPESTGAESGGKLTKPTVEVPSGPAPTKLVSKDIAEGTGAMVEKGGDITVQYVAVDYETGKKVDSSWDSGKPYSGTLGPGKTLRGWKLGIPGMKVGGRRELIIPPSLAYEGENTVLADSTLVYVIDLLAAHK